MQQSWYLLIAAALSGGVVTALIQAVVNRPKNNAEAEVTLGDGWEKLAARLEQRVNALEKDHYDLQQKYLVLQKVSLEQEHKILEQNKKIVCLEEELQKYRNPVTITPTT